MQNFQPTDWLPPTQTPSPIFKQKKEDPPVLHTAAPDALEKCIVYLKKDSSAPQHLKNRFEREISKCINTPEDNGTWSRLALNALQEHSGQAIFEHWIDKEAIEPLGWMHRILDPYDAAPQVASGKKIWNRNIPILAAVFEAGKSNDHIFLDKLVKHFGPICKHTNVWQHTCISANQGIVEAFVRYLAQETEKPNHLDHSHVEEFMKPLLTTWYNQQKNNHLQPIHFTTAQALKTIKIMLPTICMYNVADLLRGTAPSSWIQQHQFGVLYTDQRWTPISLEDASRMIGWSQIATVPFRQQQYIRENAMLCMQSVAYLLFNQPLTSSETSDRVQVLHALHETIHPVEWDILMNTAHANGIDTSKIRQWMANYPCCQGIQHLQLLRELHDPIPNLLLDSFGHVSPWEFQHPVLTKDMPTLNPDMSA